MTQVHLSKLFTALGLVLLALVANAWLGSQGEKALFNIPLLHEDRAANAFLTLFVTSTLLIANSFLGRLYATRAVGAWHARVPTVWLKRLNTASWDGQLYQFVVLVLFVGVPIAAVVHLIDVLQVAQLCVLGATNEHSSFSWLGSGIPNAGGRQIRLMQTVPDKAACSGGIEVYPSWEFLLLGMLILLSLAFAVSFLLRVGGASKQV
jgi:hypothetical protein